MAFSFNQLTQKPQPISRGNNAVLTDDEIANIVFNETASLSGTGIDDARTAIANATINGDERLGQNRPATAPSTINRALSTSEQNDLQNIKSVLIPNVRAARLNGVDPTAGAEFFNFRDLNKFTQIGLQGLTTSLNTNIGKSPSQTFGPFNNSAPSNDLGPTDIFAVIYR
jgi:hypothetical protein